MHVEYLTQSKHSSLWSTIKTDHNNKAGRNRTMLEPLGHPQCPGSSCPDSSCSPKHCHVSKGSNVTTTLVTGLDVQLVSGQRDLLIINMWVMRGEFERWVSIDRDDPSPTPSKSHLFKINSEPLISSRTFSMVFLSLFLFPSSPSPVTLLYPSNMPVLPLK